MRYSPLGSLAWISLAVVVAATGCAPSDPVERVEELRSRYDVELNQFIIKSEPVAPPEALGEEMEGEGVPAGPPEQAAAQPGDDAAAPLVEELPVTSDVVLDILVHSDASERLPGITVDVEQVDSAEQEKGRWRIWIDTSNLAKGGRTQVTHVVEDIDYEEGDGFQVELIAPVPPDLRSQYREFAEAP